MALLQEKMYMLMAPRSGTPGLVTCICSIQEIFFLAGKFAIQQKLLSVKVIGIQLWHFIFHCAVNNDAFTWLVSQKRSLQ